MLTLKYQERDSFILLYPFLPSFSMFLVKVSLGGWVVSHFILSVLIFPPKTKTFLYPSICQLEYKFSHPKFLFQQISNFITKSTLNVIRIFKEGNKLYCFHLLPFFLSSKRSVTLCKAFNIYTETTAQ